MPRPTAPLTALALSIAVLGVRAESPPGADRKPPARRIADRTFPSVFMAWAPASLDGVDPLDNIARHDLAFHGPGASGLEWNRRHAGLADGFTPASIPRALRFRAELDRRNPNFIFLAEIRYRDAMRGYLPDDHPWWKRDRNGERIVGWEEGPSWLLNFTEPDFRRTVCRQAAAAVATGVFDGVMLDWWTDDPDRLALLKQVRQAVGPDALILVNANDLQTPESAPYVNGYFMECWRSRTREDWDRIAQTLRFAETRLRQPRINCVETWYERSRADLNRMRATSCLALTHSDGYCLFSDPNDLPTGDHRHDWYDFWTKSLGKPLEPGLVAADGSARRRFEHGTAVYNPMGNEPLIVEFDEPVRSAATGQTASRFTVPGLDGDLFLKTDGLGQSND